MEAGREFGVACRFVQLCHDEVLSGGVLVPVCRGGGDPMGCGSSGKSIFLKLVG